MRYGRRRELELAALTNPAVRAAIRVPGIELISYAGLLGGGGQGLGAGT